MIEKVDKTIFSLYTQLVDLQANRENVCVDVHEQVDSLGKEQLTANYMERQLEESLSFTEEAINNLKQEIQNKCLSKNVERYKDCVPYFARIIKWTLGCLFCFGLLYFILIEFSNIMIIKRSHIENILRFLVIVLVFFVGCSFGAYVNEDTMGTLWILSYLFFFVALWTVVFFLIAIFIARRCN